MSVAEIEKTMAEPIASMIPLLQKLAKEEYNTRLTTKQSVSEREKKVLAIMSKTDKIIDSLPTAVRRTITVPRVCCADIINRPDSVEIDPNWHETFDIANKKNPNVSFVLQLRRLMQQGDYGFIYTATWTATQAQKNDCTTAAVVKVAKIPSNNLWILLEFVIHSVIMSKKILKPYFTHLLCAAVTYTDHWPHRELFLVQAFHPGVDMFEFMNEFTYTDQTLIAAVQQIAFIIYHAQHVLRFMHRDLKVENVMIFDATSMVLPSDMPETEKELFKRPPYFECEGVQFSTENIAIQLVDLGSSTITTKSNTTICNTTNRHPDTSNFNTCADMANFCLTMFLDYQDIMAIRTPLLCAHLRKIVQPMLEHMKNYPDEAVDTVSHKCATPEFHPMKIITTLQALRIGLVQFEMENRVSETTSLSTNQMSGLTFPSTSVTAP
jgi:Protein tyrosine and serine/threonine kinase